MTSAVLIFAKAPEPGRVKTRLTPQVSACEAADIAATALLDTLDAVDASGCVALIALSGSLERSLRGDALRSQLSRAIQFPQRGDSFGDRLANAHLDARRVHPAGPILQIGGDTPQVSPDILRAATEQLGPEGVATDGAERRRADSVLGLATDGGWWALGVRDAVDACVVRRVPASRADTGVRTLTALRARGLRVTMLPELRDVDTMPDARAVAAQVPRSRFARAVAAVCS
jgi:uncharacterized protein